MTSRQNNHLQQNLYYIYRSNNLLLFKSYFYQKTSPLMKSTWFKLNYGCKQIFLFWHSQALFFWTKKNPNPKPISQTKKLHQKNPAHFHQNIERLGSCCSLSRNFNGQVASISKHVFFLTHLSQKKHLFLIFSSACISTFFSKIGLKPVLNYLAAELRVMVGAFATEPLCPLSYLFHSLVCYTYKLSNVVFCCRLDKPECIGEISFLRALSAQHLSSVLCTASLYSKSLQRLVKAQFSMTSLPTLCSDAV